MTVNLQLQPLIALIAGILVLAYPEILNYVVGIYLSWSVFWDCLAVSDC